MDNALIDERGDPLVVQWLRIHLLMQETQVRSLVWEDRTCRGAAKPVLHDLQASTGDPAQPKISNYVLKRERL